MEDRPMMTAAEAAQYLGVSHDTINRLMAQGQLQGYKQTLRRNGRFRIYRDSVEAYDRQRKSRPISDKA